MKSIEVKKLKVSTFTRDGIGVYTMALTLRKPMKLAYKSERAREQLLKKIPTMNVAAVKYPRFMITYQHPGGGEYQFLFDTIKGKTK